MLDLLQNSSHTNLKTEAWYFVHQYLPFFREYLMRSRNISCESFLNLTEDAKVVLLNEYALAQVEPIDLNDTFFQDVTT